MKDRPSLPGSREMYNYSKKREEQVRLKAEPAANTYSEKLVADIPDDYPDKSKLAYLYFLQYYVEQGMGLLPIDQSIYEQLLIDFGYDAPELEGEVLGVDPAETQPKTYRTSVIASLAVEFAGQ